MPHLELPSDHLARCSLLSERMALATETIQAASLDEIDQPFRDAWNERLKRWAPLRLQCSDWWARNYNWRWGPILDDWEANQDEWERKIKERSGIEVPQASEGVRLKTDEEVGDFFKVFGSAKSSVGIALIVVGIGAGIGLAIYLGKKG